MKTRESQQTDSSDQTGAASQHDSVADRTVREVEDIADVTRSATDYHEEMDNPSATSSPAIAKHYRNHPDVEIETVRWYLSRLYFHVHVLIWGTSPDGVSYGWSDRLGRLVFGVVALVTISQATKIGLAAAGIDSGPLGRLRTAGGGAVREFLSLSGEFAATLLANDFLTLLLGVSVLLVLWYNEG